MVIKHDGYIYQLHTPVTACNLIDPDLRLSIQCNGPPTRTVKIAAFQLHIPTFSLYTLIFNTNPFS